MSQFNHKKILNNFSKKMTKSELKLAQKLLEGVSDDDADLFSVDMAQRMVERQWNLTKSRVPGKAALSIVCEEVGENGAHKTIVDVVHDDKAFLIDSVVARINSAELLIDFLLHPIVGVQYDKSKKVSSITEKSDKKSQRQSHIHIHIKQGLTPTQMKDLKRGIENALEDVVIANADWPLMLTELKKARVELEQAKTRTPAKEIAQYCDFLDYLYDNNFTLLGYREYEFYTKNDVLRSRTKKGGGLGMLRNDIVPAYINDHEEGLPHSLQNLRRKLPAIHVSKTNRIATVHRRVPMDAIAIKTYDDKGKVKGEKLFLGLFTSVTYSRSVSDVPYLREKVDDVMDMCGFIEGSHDRKALRHILEKYPRDELFQIDTDDLFDIGLNILRLQERQRISLFTRQDAFGRYISCLVYVPRDRFGTDLRKSIGLVLEEELKGTCASFHTTLDDSVFARVLFLITVKDKRPSPFNAKKIEQRLQDMGKTWPERLSEALSDDEAINVCGGDAVTMTEKYGEGFPVSYTARHTAKQAIFDISKVEEALGNGRLSVDLYRPAGTDTSELRLKVYHVGSALNLSDVLPILEDMGLRVTSELPFEVKPKHSEESIWIHDFFLEGLGGNGGIHIEDIKEQFEDAFDQVWHEKVESDRLNSLISATGMTSREVTILRAYVRYLKQINYPFSRTYIESALTTHADIAQSLVDYFKALFDPKVQKGADKKIQDLDKQIQKQLTKVNSFDFDQIIRTLQSLMQATMRTNYFQSDEEGVPKSWLSLKFDSRQVPGMPQPSPFREIFVYSPRVEAIHLRGDKVARGGLRWSDRHEDFRTEVLGLMKAQMVKNSVIVPVGSKGGFVVKTATPDRAAFMKEGVACYKTFIRGLLDITDNLKNGKVVHPPHVVRRDEDDPYLVVAADKGTASFSDTANAISQEYGFWLDDAFASGGSVGYDHKAMGITARGVWEAVKLHFRHLNHDTQTQDFDVVGVGSMAGDVFGNGMLLSEHIHLIGSFNHMHIFCDPNPDRVTSYKERRRLFDSVAGWEEYNEKVLSPGGRIYSRSDKSLKLTPEIKERFDITENTISPNDLIRKMLCARTDLLWFGGIGTYVKAQEETDSDVGDKSNDPLRICGTDLRAKVVGEGANLGMTQLGRMEFSRHGGLLNTDFTDNSAGVDSSDHEVNIKILLRDVMNKKAHNMDLKARNKLLEEMTDDVAFHVLRNNYQQTQGVSLAEFQAVKNLSAHSDFIKDLERDIDLNREIEFLSNQEEIEALAQQGKGLSRPELCVLTSYAKIQLTKDLLATDLPDQDDMQVWVTQYFPQALRKKYAVEVNNHQLRRDIVAMKMANSIVDRMGPSYVSMLRQKTGLSVKATAKAYTIVREVYDLRDIWSRIEAMDNKVPAEVQLKAMRDIAVHAKRSIAWFLTNMGPNLDIEKDVSNYRGGIQKIRQNLDKVLTDTQKSNFQRLTESYMQEGFVKELARDVAMMNILATAPDINAIAMREKVDVLDAARVFFRIGQEFHLDWMRVSAGFSKTDNPWHDEAMTGLVNQLYTLQSGFTATVLKDSSLKPKKGEDLVDTWCDLYKNRTANIRVFFEELRSAGTVDLSMLIVAEQKLRRLYGG